VLSACDTDSEDAPSPLRIRTGKIRSTTLLIVPISAELLMPKLAAESVKNILASFRIYIDILRITFVNDLEVFTTSDAHCLDMACARAVTSGLAQPDRNFIIGQLHMTLEIHTEHSTLQPLRKKILVPSRKW
jgi:hypothetical protein